MDPSFWRQLEDRLPTLDVDEIKEHLQPLTVGMALTTPIFPPGEYLYRARLVNSRFHKGLPLTVRDLSYPPASAAPLGRANRQGQSVFYCSTGKEGVFFEMPDLARGGELILGIWKTSARMIVNNIGYTAQVFKSLGARRACPDWKVPAKPAAQETVSLPAFEEDHARALLAKDKSRQLREALGGYFMRVVGKGEEQNYKLSTAIAECHLGTIVNSADQFAGIVYPSVRMWANTDNVAVQPWFVDKHLELQKALHIRVESKDGQTFSITNIDVAFPMSDTLVWLGRLPKWTISSGVRASVTLAAGRDKHGDYSRDKNGESCHWEIVDQSTGKVIEPE